MTVQQRRPLAVERIGDPAQLRQGHQLPPQRVVDRALDDGRRRDRGEVAERARHRRRGDAVLRRGGSAAAHLALVHDHALEAHAARSDDGDLQCIGIELGEPAINVAADLNEATEPGLGEACREEVLVPVLGCAGRPVDAASDRLEPPRREQALQLADRDHRRAPGGD